MKKNFISILLTLFFLPVFSFERPIVKNINAIPGKINTITVTWTLPENPNPQITEIKIFRTLKQIKNFSQLRDENPLASLPPDSTGYTDKVPNYRDYFYTVIAKTKNSLETTVIPSENATVKPVHISLPEPEPKKDTGKVKAQKTYPDGTLREKPLPYLDLLEKKNEVKIEMSLQAKSVAENLGSDKNKIKNKNFQKPYIFEEDLISPDGGDDFLLFEILKNSFIRQNYSESEKELSRLSGTKISEDVLNRATFYLGESHYFQGNYQSAVKNFLKVYEVFPELSKKWITSSLDLLEIPEF